MSVIVTGKPFFIRIECKDTTIDEIFKKIEDFNRIPDVELDEVARENFRKIQSDAFYAEDLRYPMHVWKDRKVTDRTVYVISLGYSYYTISSDAKCVYVNRRTYHDSHNPFMDADYWKPISRRLFAYGNEDKLHIDDLAVILDLEHQSYSIEQHKHGLLPSTFFALHTNSKKVEKFINSTEPVGPDCTPEEEAKIMNAADPIFEMITMKVKDNNAIPDLLTMARDLVEELKKVEGIEEVLDLSAFDIIPSPEKARARLMQSPH